MVVSSKGRACRRCTASDAWAQLRAYVWLGFPRAVAVNSDEVSLLGLPRGQKLKEGRREGGSRGWHPAARCGGLRWGAVAPASCALVLPLLWVSAVLGPPRAAAAAVGPHSMPLLHKRWDLGLILQRGFIPVPFSTPVELPVPSPWCRVGVCRCVPPCLSCPPACSVPHHTGQQLRGPKGDARLKPATEGFPEQAVGGRKGCAGRHHLAQELSPTCFC